MKLIFKIMTYEINIKKKFRGDSKQLQFHKWHGLVACSICGVTHQNIIVVW